MERLRQPVLAVLLFGAGFAFGAELTVTGDAADTSIGLDSLGDPVVGYAGNATLSIGDNNDAYSKKDTCAIVVFQLPDLGGQAISNAHLSANIYCNIAGGADPFPKGVDLYAVRASAVSTVAVTDYGFKGSGSGALIQNDVMIIASNILYGYTLYDTDAAADQALTSWLNAQIIAGAQPGDYVFLRYEMDADTANPVYVAASESTTYTPPTLALTTGGTIGGDNTNTNEMVISQHGIKWTVDGAPQTGQYANGDWWVVGPVDIIGITNNQHIYGVTPDPGMDGSEINPGVDNKHGYDSRLSNYQASRNVSMPNGSPVSTNNPLVLGVNESLVSAISWIPGEPGCPATSSNPGGPRPSIYSMAILTCVSNAPPAGSFRPPYCGTDKEPHFNVSQLRYDKLPNLDPVTNMPVLANVESNFKGPWVDHVNGWIGGFTHPYIHMPNYGREMNLEMGEAALLLLIDFDQLPGSPSKELLMTRFVQLGIDLAGIADNGGGWPCDGGHGAGRKWPILFAGLMLDDAHMQSVGQWKTDFQEDMDTFYVSQAEIDNTHDANWYPDLRGGPALPYTNANISLPEWGIRHETEPYRDNLHWSAIYRDNNNRQYPSWVLAATIMGQRSAWNHEPLFDYTDRAVAVGPYTYLNDSYRYGAVFTADMWRAYRANYPPQWVPHDDTDFYSLGGLIGMRDSDGDGLPDFWEEAHFGGGTNANPAAMASNGVNTVMEAYVAGIDPIDPSARFNVSNVWNTLGWNATSGRVYSIWWSTNLLHGFQPLETNIVWPQNSWTGQAGIVEGFYRLDVQLAD